MHMMIMIIIVKNITPYCIPLLKENNFFTILSNPDHIILHFSEMDDSQHCTPLSDIPHMPSDESEEFDFHSDKDNEEIHDTNLRTEWFPYYSIAQIMNTSDETVSLLKSIRGKGSERGTLEHSINIMKKFNASLKCVFIHIEPRVHLSENMYKILLADATGCLICDVSVSDQKIGRFRDFDTSACSCGFCHVLPRRVTIYCTIVMRTCFELSNGFSVSFSLQTQKVCIMPSKWTIENAFSYPSGPSMTRLLHQAGNVVRNFARIHAAKVCDVFGVVEEIKVPEWYIPSNKPGFIPPIRDCIITLTIRDAFSAFDVKIMVESSKGDKLAQPAWIANEFILDNGIEKGLVLTIRGVLTVYLQHSGEIATFSAFSPSLTIDHIDRNEFERYLMRTKNESQDIFNCIYPDVQPIPPIEEY